jgi:hypothetical protein
VLCQNLEKFRFLFIIGFLNRYLVFQAAEPRHMKTRSGFIGEAASYEDAQRIHL